MKKTFKLTHPKIKYDRLIEATRRDINKYVKRERKKTLPEEFDYWDFDCKFGHTEEKAKTINFAEISKCIDEVANLKLESYYLEILAKAMKRVKKEETQE